MPADLHLTAIDPRDIQKYCQKWMMMNDNIVDDVIVLCYDMKMLRVYILFFYKLIRPSGQLLTLVSMLVYNI